MHIKKSLYRGSRCLVCGRVGTNRLYRKSPKNGEEGWQNSSEYAFLCVIIVIALSLRCKGTTYLGVLLGKYAQKFLEIV